MGGLHYKCIDMIGLHTLVSHKIQELELEMDPQIRFIPSTKNQVAITLAKEAIVNERAQNEVKHYKLHDALPFFPHKSIEAIDID